MKNFVRYLLIAVLAEIAGLVLIFGIAHFSSHNLSSELKQQLAAHDLIVSKHLIMKSEEYKTNREEAGRSMAELSNLSTALNNGTGFLLGIPILSVLAAFSIDVRRKATVKSPDLIESASDTKLIFSDETAKLFFFVCVSLPILLLAGCCVLGKAWTGGVTWWIFDQSFSLLLYFWWVTILVLCGLVYTGRRAPKIFKWRYMLAVVPLVPSAMSIIWGGFWHSESQTPLFAHDGLQVQILGHIFWSFVPLALLAIYAFKGHRIFCLAVMVFELTVILSTSFVAAMAVTGTWL